MNTIIIYFSDRAPIRFTGDPIMCAIQIANAKYHSTYLAWDEIRSTRWV